MVSITPFTSEKTSLPPIGSKIEWAPELTRRKIPHLLPGTSAVDINNTYVCGKYTRYTFVTLLIHYFKSIFEILLVNEMKLERER
jgi:hypothetical protein